MDHSRSAAQKFMDISESYHVHIFTGYLPTLQWCLLTRGGQGSTLEGLTGLASQRPSPVCKSSLLAVHLQKSDWSPTGEADMRSVPMFMQFLVEAIVSKVWMKQAILCFMTRLVPKRVGLTCHQFEMLHMAKLEWCWFSVAWRCHILGH